MKRIESGAGSTSVTVDGRRVAGQVLFACVAAELTLVLLDAFFVGVNVLDVTLPIQRIFNLAREGSVGSWFGISQTMFIGFTAFALAGVSRRRGSSPGVIRSWIALGVLFLYLAVDDAAVIHERIGTLVDTWGEESSTGWTARWPSFTWQLVFGPIFLVLGLAVLWFLWRQLGEWRLRRLVVGAMLCYAVAFALDFVEGVEGLPERVAESLGWDPYTIGHSLRVLEETLEMFGMTLVWYALLSHLPTRTEKGTFRIIF